MSINQDWEEEEIYPGSPRFKTTFKLDLIPDQHQNFKKVLRATKSKEYLESVLSRLQTLLHETTWLRITAATAEIPLTGYVDLSSEI